MLPALELHRSRLSLRADGAQRLPAQPGSAWRGGFGHALRRATCLTGAESCDGCKLVSRCVYIDIFDPKPRGDGFIARYPDAPPGYVISPSEGGSFDAGATHTLDLTLFGRAAGHAELVLRTLIRLAATGLKPGQPWSLGAVERLPTPELPPAPRKARIRIESPLRLRVHNIYQRPADFSFGPFASTLIRRITQLCEVHGNATADIDARALLGSAEAVSLTQPQLSWKDGRRYSSRQHREMPTGGIVGTFVIEGDLTTLWPWLWLGQWTHVGKFTAIGLGRYRLEALP
jgi:hypothetical protein